MGGIRHIERHKTQRIGWLRAAVLGANDGIVSTASLVLGVAAAGASSQADTECADLDRERKELAADPMHEHEELAAIYVGRGLDAGLAANVATQLMAHDLAALASSTPRPEMTWLCGEAQAPMRESSGRL